MSVSISDLASASARLRHSAALSDESYDIQIRDLVAYFRQLLSSGALNSFIGDVSLLDNFDPLMDSIAYLFILRLHIHGTRERNNGKLPPDLRPASKLWSRATDFLRKFNSIQVRYAGQEWRQLVEFIGEAAQAASKPFLAIRPIRDAMLRLDPSCAVFTSTHLLLVRLCLRARAYSCALPVLDKHICHLPTLTGRAHSNSSQSHPCATHDSSLSFMTDTSGLSSRLSYRDYLQYFLCGGMVYMALKRWHQAFHFLGIVICLPTAGSISKVMVEAYKKFILVGLLEQGKLCSPPSITTPHAVKMYQSLAHPYVSLAQAFELDDMEGFKAEVDAGEGIWQLDNNAGLVALVALAFYKYAVIRLGKTFAALTVSDLAEQGLALSMSEEAAESTIASLIMSRALDARLLHAQEFGGSTMLRFSVMSSFPSLGREADVEVQLRSEGRSLATLLVNVDESNDDLGLSNEYVDSVQKGQAWSGTDISIPSAQVGFDMDEDIMGDLH